MKKMFGAMLGICGAGLAGWLIYAKFINPQPDVQAMNPLPAMLFSAGLIFVGIKWINHD